MNLKIIATLILLPISFLVKAQAIKNSSYKTANGERVLKLETIIPVDLTTTWQWFTTDAKLKKWIAPLAHIELRTGGHILTNYDSTKSLSDSSSIKLPIINFIEQELLTLKVDLNNSFPKSVIQEDFNLQEIIQFQRIDATHTKVISTMVGFADSADWEKVYYFFEKGNEWTYKELMKNF